MVGPIAKGKSILLLHLRANPLVTLVNFISGMFRDPFKAK